MLKHMKHAPPFHHPFHSLVCQILSLGSGSCAGSLCGGNMTYLTLPYLPEGEEQRHGNAMRGQTRFAWKQVYVGARGGNTLAIVAPQDGG